MRTLLISIYLLVCALSAAAQHSEPRLFESIPDVPCEDAMMRLDLLFAEISNVGLNRFIAVAIYYEGNYKERTYTRGGKFVRERSVAPVLGEVQQRVRWLQNYTNFRNFPKDKIRFISGGARDTFGIDLWIVPIGSPLPNPTPSKEKVKYRNGKVTEFYCS